MVVIRYLFVLLIGALLGAAGIGFALQKGYGDFFIKPAPVVADLQRRLDGMEQERNRLARQLESVEGRAAKMEKLFGDLEARFQGLSGGTAPAEPAAATPPPVVASPSTTIPPQGAGTEAGQPTEAPATP